MNKEVTSTLGSLSTFEPQEFHRPDGVLLLARVLDDAFNPDLVKKERKKKNKNKGEIVVRPIKTEAEGFGQRCF